VYVTCTANEISRMSRVTREQSRSAYIQPTVGTSPDSLSKLEYEVLARYTCLGMPDSYRMG
jgi:hypothetical protein